VPGTSPRNQVFPTAAAVVICSLQASVCIPNDRTRNRLKKTASVFTATRTEGLYSQILQMPPLCQQGTPAALLQEPAVPPGDAVAMRPSVRSSDGRFQTTTCSTGPFHMQPVLFSPVFFPVSHSPPA